MMEELEEEIKHGHLWSCELDNEKKTFLAQIFPENELPNIYSDVEEVLHNIRNEIIYEVRLVDSVQIITTQLG